MAMDKLTSEHHKSCKALEPMTPFWELSKIDLQCKKKDSLFCLLNGG